MPDRSELAKAWREGYDAAFRDFTERADYNPANPYEEDQ